MISHIRNFAIIAHIDHGKSTLADRFLELTGLVETGKHEEQMLDRNPISRERGITIKLAPVRMVYKNVGADFNPPEKRAIPTLAAGRQESPLQEYILNLIDTPGHVDFSYEVDRTLACVEGVILLVDATQGIQAQTISNAYKAIEEKLTIIPVVNKIDLPQAKKEETKRQLADFLGIDEKKVFMISAKTGEGVDKLLQAVIEKIPPPHVGADFNPPEKRAIPTLAAGRQESPLQSLIFDSYYDPHKGVIAFVRVFDGEIEKGMKLKLSLANLSFNVSELGFFLPDLKPAQILSTGEIGYVVTGLKDIHKVRVGDTIVNIGNDSAFAHSEASAKSMVYASIFPTDNSDFTNLKKALEELYLNDSALRFSSIHSRALGAGFRVGFLGLLHADVVRERLEREFGLNLVLTPPQVEYKLGHDRDLNGKEKFKEPYVKIIIITPQTYLGGIMQLCQKYRAKFLTMDNVVGNSYVCSLHYEMPMSEMISDFYDHLKSVTAGYASLDWEFLRYEPVLADKLTLLINEDEVEEFSEIVVEERAYEKAHSLVTKLKEIIPRQQYEVKIQAKYKGKIIASSKISPFRKNVLLKGGKVLGTGDVGRKRKLLERQKEGKKRMKMVGKVEIPKEAFMKLFRK